MTRRSSISLEREFRANQEIIRILEVSKALSETIFDQLPVLLVMVDDNQRILKVNKIGQELLHIDESKVLGAVLTDFLPNDAGNNVETYFKQAKVGLPDPLSFETEMKHGGERRFFHWHLNQVYKPNAKVRQKVHVLIGNDTTSARLAFEKLVDLRHDLEVGGTVQNLLLPKSTGLETNTYEFAVHYEPSAQVGGDIWWYRKIEGAGTLLVVCDVMGHGVGSAIASATFIGAIESEFRDRTAFDPKSITTRISELDNVLSGRFEKSMMFCTTVLWLPESDEPLLCWNMGLPPVIRSSKSGEIFKERIQTSDPLGVGVLGVPAVNEIKLGKDDRLYVFSDGCYEFEYGGRDYGRSRFGKLVVKLAEDGVKAGCDKFAAMHKELRGTPHPKDDVTLAIITRKI